MCALAAIPSLAVYVFITVYTGLVICLEDNEQNSIIIINIYNQGALRAPITAALVYWIFFFSYKKELNIQEPQQTEGLATGGQNCRDFNF